MIKDTTVVNAGRKDVTDLEIKKPYTLFQCNKFMKAIAGQTNTSVITQL
jgi:hypothetical protein